MTQRFDEDGNMITYKGDTILFDIHDVPTDLDYTIYFGVYDDSGNAIIPEQSYIANGNDTVTIEVKPYVTDTVIIPTGKKSVTFRYGIKACNFENQVEHTQTVDGVEVGDETKITFVREQAKGITDWNPTEAPTEEPTEAPSEEPTEEPTEAP